MEDAYHPSLGQEVPGEPRGRGGLLPGRAHCGAAHGPARGGGIGGVEHKWVWINNNVNLVD